MNRVVFGVNLGSRLSGNTVVCIFNFGKIHFMQVDKDVDADAFLLKAVRHFKPQHIFMDAPMSLPGKYRGLEKCDNYHFRKADIELKAMSPMFLGGLTARAMELKESIEALEIPIFETCPRKMASLMGLQDLGYKTGKAALSACRSSLKSRMNPAIQMDCSEISTWHHLDALLATLSALNLVSGQEKIFGDKEEGCIYI
jgi:uncharacterized protein